MTSLDLGRMQAAPAAEVAAAMALVQYAAAMVAAQSMRANNTELHALSESTITQATAIEQSLKKQAEALMKDFMQNVVSGAGGLLMQGVGLASQIYSSYKVGNLDEELHVGNQYETAMQEGLARDPDPMLIGAEGEAGAAARRAQAEQGVRELRELTEFGTERLDNERLEEIRTNVALTKGSPDGRERISQAFENLSARKKYLQRERSYHLDSINTSVQRFNNFGQLITMGAQAAASYQKAGIERLRADIEKTRALAEYVNTVYNQLLQISLAMYNQNIDRSKQEVDALQRIVEANRPI